MTERYADFHIHTTKSDGQLSPSEVVLMAKNAGLSAIAVTDHDTTAGVAEAVEEGKKHDVKVVSGIELSAYSNEEIHILGYNIDHSNPEFVNKLEYVRELRRLRNAKIKERLKAAGVELEGEYGGTKGRVHIADEIVRLGYAQTRNDAFDKYIGKNGCCYVTAERLKPLEAVKLIADCGGLPVIAHPKRFCQHKTIKLLAEGLMPYGLKGIEVFYPTHSQADIDYLLGLCRRFKLLATGGSDFHFPEQNFSLMKIPVSSELARAFNI